MPTELLWLYVAVNEKPPIESVPGDKESAEEIVIEEETILEWETMADAIKSDVALTELREENPVERLSALEIELDEIWLIDVEPTVTALEEDDFLIPALASTSDDGLANSDDNIIEELAVEPDSKSEDVEGTVDCELENAEDEDEDPIPDDMELMETNDDG